MSKIFSLDSSDKLYKIRKIFGRMIAFRYICSMNLSKSQ